MESVIKSLYSITLKSNSPPWTLKGSFTHAWFWKILVYPVIQIYQMLTHFFRKYQKITLISIIIGFSKNVFTSQKTVKHRVVNMFSKIPILTFHLTAQITGNIHYQVFFLKCWYRLLIYFWENITQHKHSKRDRIHPYEELWGHYTVYK